MLTIGEWFDQPLPLISSTQYWFKVAGPHQTNWAVVEPSSEGATVYFFHDEAGIFDRLEFNSVAEAESGLARNEFSIYDNSGFWRPDNKPYGLAEWGLPNFVYSQLGYWK